MSDTWIKNLQKGMLVRIVSSIEKELIGKLGIVKLVTKNSPRNRRPRDLDGADLSEIEVLVMFPDIQEKRTVMITRTMTANQVGKATRAALDATYYEKVFRPEHIAPATTMDRLLYG